MIAIKKLGRWETNTLKTWVKALPEEVLHRRPDLCLVYSVPFLYEADWEQCEYFLKKAEDAAQEENQHKLVAVWATRGFIAFSQGDAIAATTCGRKAVHYARADDPLARALSMTALAHAHHLAGRLTEAEQAYVEAIAASEKAGNFVITIADTTFLAHVRERLGKLHQAAETLRSVMRFETHQFPVQLSYAHSLNCDLAREWNDLEAAENHLQTLLQINERLEPENSALLMPDSLKCLTGMLWKRAAEEEALQLIERNLTRARKQRHALVVQQTNAIRAWLCLLQEDIASPKRWAEESKMTLNDHLAYDREIEYLIFARVLIAQSKCDEAVKLLQQLLAAAEAGGRMRSVIEILALQALAFWTQRDANGAVTALQRALALAEPESYIRIFVDEGAPMVDLLREFLRMHSKGNLSGSSSVSPNYVVELISAFPPELVPAAIKTHVTSASLPVSYLVDPLSERELEVLKLIAAGLSNDEIAKKLYLATSTVKRHINNIYAKLDVHSRTQAVVKAKELKVLAA